ncbi:hypothetical protein [Sphingomonas sp. Leaf25]|uniref:hypothetical protein n=1 Tax=Sphingomonas sp. Leaf25 TaxID=1735692 RepID=UPI0006FF20C6|nr:hypothetical protein [Sphingomonas sp. Leaf25]KQM97999.1 hypothetical protein ASE78_06925 [Sphingomonas sp. Leaf25]
MIQNVFELLHDASAIMLSSLDAAGLKKMWEERQLTVRSHTRQRSNEPALFFVGCVARTRGGLRVPIERSIVLGTNERYDPQDIAEPFISAFRRVAAIAASVTERKAGLRTATERAVADGIRKGAQWSLIDIVERPVAVISERSDIEIYFDVSMTMIIEQDLGLDVCIMDAWDSEEFTTYLNGSVLDEQIELARRLQATGVKKAIVLPEDA